MAIASSDPDIGLWQESLVIDALSLGCTYSSALIHRMEVLIYGQLL